MISTIERWAEHKCWNDLVKCIWPCLISQWSVQKRIRVQVKYIGQCELQTQKSFKKNSHWNWCSGKLWPTTFWSCGFVLCMYVDHTIISIKIKTCGAVGQVEVQLIWYDTISSSVFFVLCCCIICDDLPSRKWQYILNQIGLGWGFSFSFITGQCLDLMDGGK